MHDLLMVTHAGGSPLMLTSLIMNTAWKMDGRPAVSDLIRAVRAKADIIRAVVVTRSFQFEGDIHTPKLGKEGRRLSNMLNSDRNFIAMTNVTIVNRSNGSKDPKPAPLIQVSLNSIEFIRPYLDEEAIEQESREVDSPRSS